MTKHINAYTIDHEGDLFRVTHRVRRNGWHDDFPCGLFKRLKDARKSLAALRKVDEDRKFPESIEEYR